MFFVRHDSASSVSSLAGLRPLGVALMFVGCKIDQGTGRMTGTTGTTERATERTGPSGCLFVGEFAGNLIIVCLFGETALVGRRGEDFK